MSGWIKSLSTAIHVFFGFGHCCRFEPSCSQYAEDAIERFGFFRGAFLAAQRILRCHPFGGWEFDPVKEAKKT